MYKPVYPCPTLPLPTSRLPPTHPVCAQVVPHSFGRSVPPVIQSMQTVQQKYDLCNVLKDIEAAQQMSSSAQVGGGLM